MLDDGQFGEAIHALLRELGWTHGELTPSLVYQALAQVRHLRKQAAKACDLSDAEVEALRHIAGQLRRHELRTPTEDRALAALSKLLGER